MFLRKSFVHFDLFSIIFYMGEGGRSSGIHPKIRSPFVKGGMNFYVVMKYLSYCYFAFFGITTLL